MKIFGIRITRHAPHAHVQRVNGRAAKNDRPHAAPPRSGGSSASSATSSSATSSSATSSSATSSAPQTAPSLSKPNSEAAARELADDPGKFLASNKLVINGSSTQSNDVPHYLVPMSADGTSQDMKGDFPSWRLTPIKPNDDAHAAEVKAASFKMQQTQTLKDNGQAPDRLKIDTSSDKLIVTGQITGCTAGVYEDSNGDRWVTHLQPSRGNPADDQQVMRQLAVGDATKSAAYQNTKQHTDQNSYDSGKVRSTVIGHVKNGKVKFYVQEASSSGEVIGVRRIMRLPGDE